MKKHIISFVGGGGKTTLMYAFAEKCCGEGLRTLVTTTTHIARPQEKFLAENREEILQIWDRNSYAVVGHECDDGKLSMLSAEELNVYIDMADMALIEADGAKRLPCKVPASHEPVLLEKSDIVIGVMGMDALGRPLKEACFRWKEAAELLKAAPDTRITKEMMAAILTSEKGTKKSVGDREYYIALNKCDTLEICREGRAILAMLGEKGYITCRGQIV